MTQHATPHEELVAELNRLRQFTVRVYSMVQGMQGARLRKSIEARLEIAVFAVKNAWQEADGLTQSRQEERE